MTARIYLPGDPDAVAAATNEIKFLLSTYLDVPRETDPHDRRRQP